jgi:hypothetical protein
MDHPSALLEKVMSKKSSDVHNRRGLMSGAALFGAASLLPEIIASAQAEEVAQSTPQAPPIVAPDAPPGGYNILFILVPAVIDFTVIL